MRQTIKSKREIESLFSRGRRMTTSSVMALFDATRAVRDEACSAGRKSGRIAVIAGKRLGAAPRRNRAKRLIREAVRQSDARWPGYDVLLIARERLFDGGLMLVQSDIQRITARLHGGNTNEG